MIPVFAAGFSTAIFVVGVVQGRADWVVLNLFLVIGLYVLSKK